MVGKILHLLALLKLVLLRQCPEKKYREINLDCSFETSIFTSPSHPLSLSPPEADPGFERDGALIFSHMPISSDKVRRATL